MLIRIQKTTHRKTFKTQEQANEYAEVMKSAWVSVGVWDLSQTDLGRKGFMVFCSGKYMR